MKKDGKLSNLIRTSFLLPNCGLNLFIMLELYYFSYFLTDVCGFTLNTVTFILTSTAAVDVVWIFVTGIMLEKCNFKKMGKYRAWYVIASPIVIIFFSLMFLDFGSSMLAAAFVILCFNIKTLFEDIQCAAVTAHLSQMTDDVYERSLLAARRNQGAVIGQLIFSLAAVPLITFAGNLFSNVAMGYTIAAIVFSVVNAIFHLLLYRATKEAPVAQSEITKKEALSVKDMFKILFTNPPLLVISFGDIFRYVAFLLTSSAAAYYFANVLRDSGSISLYLTIQTILGIIAAVIVNTIVKVVGKKAVYVIGTLIYALSLIAAYFTGGEGHTMAFVIVMSVGFFANSLIGTVTTAMVSDTVIYTMWKQNINARGFIMSMLNLPIKCGSLIKSAILPIGLSLAGYVAGTRATASSSKGIAIIMCVVPGVFVLIACLSILLGYSLTEKRVSEMTEEVNSKA